VIRIAIGRRNYLLYLLLPHRIKWHLLTPASRAKLDLIHRYAEDEQHEYPARPLVAGVWSGSRYGRALEVGAGSGYFTTLIARHARTVIALEPVADIRAVPKGRCRAEGVDTAFVIQSLHHLHDRERVFEALGRVVRPGSRLLMVEPHHDLRRVGRLLRKYLFLTRGELRALSRRGGFGRPRLSGYWIPYSRRLILAADRRFRAEARLGRWPVFRHWAAVLALEARRLPESR
jgi:SAM-dependent methyltransferase